jgi:hypothetical protein
MTPKLCSANLDFPERNFYKKICVDGGFMVQMASPLRAVEGPEKLKKKVNMTSSGNCLFHAFGEETQLNRLSSFIRNHVTSPTLSIA